MNTIFGGQVYLIDADAERAQCFKKRLLEVNPNIFFCHLSSVRDALDLALTPGIISPDHIFTHASLADFTAKDVLKRYRIIKRTKQTEVTVYGEHISQGLVLGSVKYNFKLLHVCHNMGAEGFTTFDNYFKGKEEKTCYPASRCC